MANIRVKDLPNTDTLVDGDELIVDSSSAGTRRISFGELKSETASDFVAAPSTYKVATLAADNKLDPSQIPDTLTNGLNFVGVANSAPDLASTTQGDFYVIGTAFGVYSVGDQAVYDGSAYVRVTDGTKQIGEGGTGATTAAGARTNLSVNSKDEDAEATGTKLVGPALYFRGAGPNDFVEVAHDARFSFTDGTDDLPFSVSAWVNMGEVANDPIVCKYGTSNPNREWLLLITSGKVALYLHDGSVEINASTVDTITAGQWFHVAVTYAGTSSGSFASAADNISIHINGKVQSVTRYNHASYAGMPNTAQALWVGRYSNTYSKGHIRDVKIYNRSLSATEVAQLARGNDLGFAEEWGDHTTQLVTDGDMESVGTADWATSTGTVTKESSDPHAGTQNLKFISSGGYVKTAAVPLSANKRYRAGFWYRTGGTSPASYTFRIDGSSWQTIATLPENASWTYVSYEFSTNNDTVGKPTFYISGGDATTYIEVDELAIHSIGTLADFRAENFDSDTGKIYDLSSNGFVGTSANLPTLTGRAYPVYETGTWTPGLEFAGGSTGITYGANTFGHYTRVGNVVNYSGYLTLTSKGSDTGLVYINGLPFSVSTSTDNHQSGITVGIASNMAGLSGPVSGLHLDADTRVLLYDWGATGTASLDDTNITNTTEIRFSGTYQIQ